MTADSLVAPGRTIVIVEDDIALLESARFSLELEGWTVAAYSTAEALLAGEPLPNLGCLVIDQGLPGASGIALLSCLRDRGVELPAIIITTNPTAQIRERADACKAQIVEKPLLGSVLVEAISKALA